MAEVTAASAANTQPPPVQDNVEAANVGCLCGMSFSGFSLSRIIPAPLKQAANFVSNRFNEIMGSSGGRITASDLAAISDPIGPKWPTSDHVEFAPNEGYKLKNFDSLPAEMKTFYLGSYGGKMLCHFEYDSPHAFEMCKDAELLRELIKFKENGGDFKAYYIQHELARIEDNVLYFNPRFCGPLNDPKTALRDAMRDALGLPPLDAPVVEEPIEPTPVGATTNRYLREGTEETSNENEDTTHKAETVASSGKVISAGSAKSGVIPEGKTADAATVVLEEEVKDGSGIDTPLDTVITPQRKPEVDVVLTDGDQLETKVQDEELLLESEHAVTGGEASESLVIPESELETEIEADVLTTTAAGATGSTAVPVTDSVAPERGIGMRAFNDLRDVFQNGAPPKQSRRST